MPRFARKKSTTCMYHIMSRSISEIDLFLCDDDKEMYLRLLKRYIDKFHCKIYAYCLMSNHVHFFINSCGYDISSFMRSLNTAYVVYFNRRYKRHGHLFQGRFTSKTVEADKYGLTLSAYIHNNARDLSGFQDCPGAYRYSSYGVYAGSRFDLYGLLDCSFLLGFFNKDKRLAQQKYHSFVESLKGSGKTKEIDRDIYNVCVENEYRNEKRQIVRFTSSDELIKKIGSILGERLPDILRTKHRHETSDVRSFVIYVIHVLCGYSYKKICQLVGNISMSGVSRLSGAGFLLVSGQARYSKAFRLLWQN